MDARRWSPLWVFVGGCLTGAALIGLHSRGGPESASNSQRADGLRDVAQRSLKAGSVEGREHAEPAAVEVATRGRGEAPDTAERDKAEAGNSVAEVLARLETEYRQQTAPAAVPAPASAPVVPGGDEPAGALANEPPRELAQEQAQAQAPSAVSGASGPKLAASEHSAVVQAAAPAPEAPPSDVRVATLSADSEPTAPAAEEAARLASVRDEQAKALSSGQQQLAQMQELAALQQATLLEQYTLFQLQLLSLSPASGTTVLPARSQRRTKAKGGRIVASLPSSISDMDNPWGFDLQRSVLVR